MFRYFIFWMICFWTDKIIFLLWNIDQSRHLSFGEVSGIFGYGLKMDISMACYLLVFPGILLFFNFVLSKKTSDRLIKGYTIVLLIIISFLAVLDLGLYPHWGTRVNVTAFNYIHDPVAMKASLTLIDLAAGVFVWGIFIFLFLFLYRKMFPSGFSPERNLKWSFSLLWLFLTALLIIPIRGGFDTSPLNLSSVAFSPKLFVNQSAANFLWNFADSVDKREKFSNPCLYMPEEESERIFECAMKSDTTVSPLRLLKAGGDKMPDVILVILEGFSNKVIASLGGLAGIAPNLDSLCHTGTVFTRFYASGNRSDRGISALLGSYPSLLNTSVMLYPEKASGLILLQEYFNRHGYFTSFYYGGDINFYNLRAFVLQGNTRRIISKSDFPPELGRMTKWGIPDGFLFDKAFEDLKNEREPFLQMIYTVSSHPPYDVPYLKIRGNQVRERYLNSVAYTDSCLGSFIRSLRNSPFWENTLLIVTSDHGHMQPGPTDITDPGTYLIPMIWSGGVIDSVRRIDTIAMQSDFVETLIHQMGWDFLPAKFSRDIFRRHPCAFYMLETGWGYITPSGSWYFDQNTKAFAPEVPGTGDKEFPKAFMQVLHNDFLNR